MRLTASSIIFAFALTASLTSGVVRGDGENLLENGNFEKGLDNWSSMWSRDGSGCVNSELANKTQSSDSVHSGSHAAHLTHTCTRDWSFQTKQTINVTYEGRYEISYWTKVKENPKIKVGAISYNETGSVLNWDVADTKATSDTNGEWVHVTGYIWITNQDTSYIVVRCIGEGKGEVYVDDITLKSIGKKPLFLDLSTGNKDSVEVRMNTQIGTINVTLPGTDLKWEQVRIWGPKIAKLVSYDKASAKIELTGGYNVDISLTKGVPEIVYRISSDGNKSLNMFPHPFNSTDGHAIIPLNEGISFPINSGNEIGSKYYSLASGHGLCMAFW